MLENQVFEYSLSSGQNEQVLKMKMSKTHIILSVEYHNGKLFTAYVNSQQLKDVCKAFIRTKSLKEIVMILHNTIESGNISLTEDEKGLSIELIFSIKLASGNYPPFSIILELEERNSLKGKKAVNNKKVEKKNGKSIKNSTEYNKPIVEPNYKKPIVQLEYIEPILQVHYPDGTTKSTTLPARIQTVDGKIPNIDEAQFKLIQQEMNKHMENQNKEGADKSKYSLNTVPSQKSRNDGIKAETNDGNEGEEKSKYSTFSVSAKPIVYPEQKYDKNNQYSNYSQNNNIIEYAPNMINQNQYQDNDSYQFAQQEVDFNQLIGQNNSHNYNNYSNYTNDNYSNYYNYQSGNQYQTGYYTQNSYDFNQLFQNQNQNQYQYQYQNYEYQPQNYQYQNNNFSSSYPQTFSNQFEQAFAEVIPLKPIQEFLQSQNAKAQEQENKKVESPQGYDKDKKDEKNQKREEKEEENEEEEEGEEYEEEEDDENEEVNENQNNEEGNENQKERNENQNNEEGNENQNNEEVNENQNNEEGEEAQKESEQENTEDFETLYRTEEGLIIYRNGILKGIIDKYSEIDNVVTKIQIIISKGAKFNLLYKATIHGDKASVFHEKCDNHQMTLVLVETTKNVRFGGFTTETWDGHCIKKTDNNAFVFSIDKNKIYGIIPNQPAIGCYPKFGPVFFGCQIRIYDDFFTKGGTTCLSELNYNTTQDYELNNGEQKYIVKDIEVYDIEGIDI